MSVNTLAKPTCSGGGSVAGDGPAGGRLAAGSGATGGKGGPVAGSLVSGSSSVTRNRGGASRTRTLPVAGIIPFSATDWPGNITITIFTQGCPLRCVYCHNPSLQAFGAGSHDFAEALALAVDRQSLIDGVVISGGEPTAVPGLADAITAVHETTNLPVGLHTCGYSPARIARLLERPESTPDWVGLDIKALPRHMPEVTGCTAAVSGRVWDSLRLLIDAGVDLQLRTTLWRDSIISRHLPELQHLVSEQGFDLVIQQARAADGSPFHLV